MYASKEYSQANTEKPQPVLPGCGYGFEEVVI